MAETTLDESLNKLEASRNEAMSKADYDYYNRSGTHYNDNMRYRWAIEFINNLHAILVEKERKKYE